MLLYCAGKCWDAEQSEQITFPSINFIFRWVLWSKAAKRNWDIVCWQQAQCSSTNLITLRRQKPNSWSLVSRNSLEAFETLFNNWRGDTWSLARDNNNKDNLWCLFCKRVWGHTVTQGASLLLQIPFRSWQFGERRGSCYLCSCTDGWEKDTADIPYSKLNEELNRAK